VRFQPRLRTLLLALSSITFLLSWAGLVALRFYDNQLVRQTESELIAEGRLRLGALPLGAARRRGAGRLRDRHRRPSRRRRRWCRRLRLRWRRRPPPHLRRRSSPLGPISIFLPTPFGLRPRRRGPLARRPMASPRGAGRRASPVLVDAKPIALSGARIVDPRGVASSRRAATSSGSASPIARRSAGRSRVSWSRWSGAAPPTARAPPTPRRAARPACGSSWRCRSSTAGGSSGRVVLSRTPMTLGKAFYQDRYTLLVTALVLLTGISIRGAAGGGVHLAPRARPHRADARHRRRRRRGDADPPSRDARDRRAVGGLRADGGAARAAAQQ